MTEITILEPAAKSAGLKITNTSLSFVSKPDDVQLHAAIRLLLGLERSRQWWWGDFLCALQSYRGARYTSDLLEDAGVVGDHFRDYKGVAEFYLVGERSPTLTWSMHWMAWKVCRGDKQIALNWLERAQLENWSVRDMQAVAKQIAEFDTSESVKLFRKLTSFDRWIEDQIEVLAALPAERKRGLLEKMPAVVKLVEALKS